MTETEKEKLIKQSLSRYREATAEAFVKYVCELARLKHLMGEAAEIYDNTMREAEEILQRDYKRNVSQF